MAFEERDVIVAVVDIANFTGAVSGMDALAIAELLERTNVRISECITNRGGRVVKYLGDGCLAVFPPDAAEAAVDAAGAMTIAVREVGDSLGRSLGVGVNLHRCVVAEGRFAPENFYDVIGAGIMHTFRMGAGTGVRISEPVYRQLPSARRSAWQKHQPPATYTLSA